MSDLTRKNIVVSLTGNLQNDPAARAKYGNLIKSLDRRSTLLGVIDAEVAGLPRLVNAIRSFQPNLRSWKERFRKNPYAHAVRSRAVWQHIGLISRKFDFVLQLGALFESLPSDSPIPTYVYTDYTYLLAGEKPGSGRSPFSPKELAQLADLERNTFLKARKVFVRSQMVRESIVEDYSINPDKVIVVGAGVNYDPLPSIVRKEPGKTLLFVGLDFHRKGGDIVLKAFELVKEQLPDAELLLLTRDRIPRDYSLEGVRLVSPTWDREKLAELYRIADLFVLPSRLETWGDVLLEAMAFGVPCVGVQQDAMAEIITHGKTGCLVPEMHPDALAEVLVELLSNQERIRTMGIQARKSIEQRFTWDLVVDRILSEISL